ncbi:MAG: TIM barrel protein, partial [Verrucomicrobiota bacterium]|nr:TIM barrel protein [Verrucomicrobiota bacterium]
MPKLATFPNAELEALVDGSMRLSDYLAFASGLDVDGVELYPLIVDLEDPGTWNNYRHACNEMGLEIPMLCCSPDFTHPDPAFRAQEIEKEKRWIEMSNALGARFCRVLSGQRRPEVSREEGIELAATSIQACLPFAAE